MPLAASGDTILVSDADAFHPDSAYADAFTVKSGVRVVAKSGQTPIIDGGSLRATAVAFAPGASSGTILQGFTIRGGTDTVVVVRGSGTIRDCTIGDISSTIPPYGSAGIHIEGDGSVKHCTISMTKHVNAGIRALGPILVDSCTVETNSTGGPAVAVALVESDGAPLLQASSVSGPGAGLREAVTGEGTVSLDNVNIGLTGGSGVTGIQHSDGGLTLSNCVIDLPDGTGILCGWQSVATTLAMFDCTIDVDYGTGIDCEAGSVAGFNTVVTIHEADTYNTGIQVATSSGPNVSTVKGVLVRGLTHYGAGVDVFDDGAVIENVTVDGFELGFYDSNHGSVKNTVQNCIASNYGNVGFDYVTAAYCIADGSGSTAYGDCVTDATDKTEDPLYCDASGGAFTLRVDSYGNPHNNGSGEEIGAYPVACMYGTLVRDADYEEGGTLDFPGDLTVPSGKTLTLGAATTVKAGPGDSQDGGADTTLTELVVDGTLDVTGTSADGVTFDSGASPRGEGDWYGLYAGDGSTMNLAYATVKYAETGAAYDDADGGIVRHCTFSNNENLDLVVGVYSSSSVEVDTCTVDVGGGSGIQLTNDGSGVNLIGNSVYGGFSSVRGIYGLLDSGTGTASGNSVSGFVFGSAIGIHSGGMTFVKNNVSGSKYGFEVTGGTAVLGDTTDSGSDNLAHGNTDGLYCTGAGVAPTVRESQFYSNSVGVLARSSASPDLGNSAHHGYNSFYSNTSYCVRNTTSGTAVDALGDWWGSCSAPTCTSGPVLTLLWLCSQPASVEEPIAQVGDGRPGFRVMGAAPNPTAGAGRILFHLDGAPSRVEAQVFDVAGRLVRSLGPEEFPAGDQALTWDGRDRSGRPVGEGLYFVRVQAGSEPAATTKILVVR